MAHVKKYSGIQIEGDSELYDEAQITKTWLTELINSFVDESTAGYILERALFLKPDLFSVDIDGNDYFITKGLLEKGLLPKIMVVEYNAAFGANRSITIPYNPAFNMFKSAHPYLYYGVSIGGWENLLSRYNYEFVTVESNGINAFFIQPGEFEKGFTSTINKFEFKENIHQLRLFRKDSEGQFDLVKDLLFYEI